MSANRFEVEVRPQGQQPRFFQMDARLQELLLRAKHNHSNVDELLSLYTWHQAKDSVVK
jgi:hypothetical protein